MTEKYPVNWAVVESKFSSKHYAKVGTNVIGAVAEKASRISLGDSAQNHFLWERWLPPAQSGRAPTIDEAKDRLTASVAEWFDKLEHAT